MTEIVCASCYPQLGGGTPESDIRLATIYNAIGGLRLGEPPRRCPACGDGLVSPARLAEAAQAGQALRERDLAYLAALPAWRRPRGGGSLQDQAARRDARAELAPLAPYRDYDPE